jgi:hypothetical protein
MQEQTKTPWWAEAAGWYGMLAIMIAYAGVSMGWMGGKGLVFQLINLTGAMGLMTISWIKRVRQNVILNLFWAAIAIIAIIRLF